MAFDEREKERGWWRICGSNQRWPTSAWICPPCCCTEKALGRSAIPLGHPGNTASTDNIIREVLIPLDSTVCLFPEGSDWMRADWDLHVHTRALTQCRSFKCLKWCLCFFVVWCHLVRMIFSSNYRNHIFKWWKETYWVKNDKTSFTGPTSSDTWNI